ncbi:biogenesis of lysosome-related organelles complex 1 subunit 2 [Brevipalpus obovatus]|uniref:biogenesis of lysosome-related organelles complex 1 subunit 2 n=1 Tax=Brevipalpus obovatus TaxID=246614 RepID=UPI003D9DC33B
MDEKIGNLTEKVKEYLSSEMSITLEDYKTLEKMNQVTANKYHDMKVKCDEINQAHQNLKSKYECLSEYFAQIDNLEKKIDTLEEMAYSIDLYTKKLENQFKKLENP